MEIRVLGALEVERGGESIDVRGTKRRAVLALLVLHANEVVRTERLIDDIWGDRRPTNAQAALQNHVSRLRKDIGSDVLVTKPWGYVLRIDPEAIDLRRFERLVAESRPLPAAERAAMLREALALWKGPPLADLRSEEGLAREIDVLDDLYLLAVEERVDADLELDGSPRLVHELEALVAEHPVRERLRGQLILALYRTGRQAEALETYRETRRVLVEELGIEPSKELRELEQAILRQDQSLVLVAANASQRDHEPERSRWRWPRSPLAIAVALVLIGGAGVLSAAVMTSDESAAGGAEPLTSSSAVATQRPSMPKPKPPPTTTTNHPEPPASTTTIVHVFTTTTPEPQPPVTSHPRPTQPQPTTVEQPTTTTTTPKPKPPTTTTPTAPVHIQDDFNDASINPSLWAHYGTNQPGNIALSQASGALTVSVSGTATDDFHAGLTTRCKARGDFDARLSFNLAEWPARNGVWVSLLTANTGGFNTYRVSWHFPAQEEYGAYLPPAGTTVFAAGTDGVLRLTRRGSVWTGYRRSSSGWVSIASGVGPTHDIQFNPSVFNSSDVLPFGGKATTVEFRRFSVSAGKFVCP